MTLVADRPTGAANPAEVARKEGALVTFLRDHPNSTVNEIAAALSGETRGAIVSRLCRMSDRGVLAKSGGGLWRIAGAEEEGEPVELEPAPEPAPEPDDPTKWVKPIGRFVRRDTGDFSCRRYG
jgi:hypothetical protein